MINEPEQESSHLTGYKLENLIGRNEFEILKLKHKIFQFNSLSLRCAKIKLEFVAKTFDQMLKDKSVAKFTEFKIKTTQRLEELNKFLDKIKTEDKLPRCQLCCDKQVEILFLYGHINCCESCQESLKNCPECNKLIESRLNFLKV